MLTNPERKQKQAEQQKKLEAQRAALIRDFNETFSSAEGKIVLKWLYDFCGYDKSMASTNRKSGEIIPNNIIHNAALHSVWAHMRKFLSRDILISVEISSGSTQSDLFN